jgi:signal transduction histidine kinase
MFRKISRYLFEQPDKIGLENYIFLIICFSIATIGFFSTALNYFLGLAGISIISNLIIGHIFTGIFLYSRIYNKYGISKYVLVILSIIVLNIQWAINYGSNGPIPYLFVVMQCIILLLLEKRAKISFTILIFVNVSVLFFMEYGCPDLFGKYSSDQARLIDSFVGTLIYLSVFTILINVALSFYIKQKDKAENSDKLKTSFLANMSHEIRTPMNAIIGFGNLLYESDLDQEQKHFINIINNNSYHLLQLIDDIIDISKIESNQLKIKIEYFPVYHLFEELEQLILQFIKKHNKPRIQLICNRPSESLQICSDYTRIKQVLTNLLSNATKFTESGNIVFGCNVNPKSVTFYVQDTGIGIEGEYLDEIFHRFKKIENFANEKIYRGTGLGLSISKQLVELLKGEIWVESKPGKGSRFSFSIPAEISYKNKLDGLAKDKSPNLKFSGEIVLIAEDEDDNYHFLQDMFNRHNIKSIRANNGQEAIELFRVVQGIRLVLLDIKMPKMDGTTAAKLIREFNPNIPIIAQTAYAMGNDQAYFLKSGFDGYISKPIEPEILLNLINKHLKRN